MLKRILVFAAAVEIATGLALLADPRLVIALLLGGGPVQAMPLGRVAGILMLSLGVACFPRRISTPGESAALHAMLIYNALIAAYLTYLFAAEHLGGVLLWPAVALHAAVAILLAGTWRGEASRRAAR